MIYKTIVLESAASELAQKLPSLKKHDYDTIDKLMQNIAKKHKITGKALHNLFVHKYKKTPDNWIKGKLDEQEEEHIDFDNLPIMQEFIRWTVDKINLETQPKFEWSYDHKEAQQGHHTGRHTEGTNDVWVYVKNRNLVDIMRTVFHELVHCRQSELGMIEPGDSYPGSPIEMEADMMAGKYMKVFGKKHPEIFQ
jgi:CHAD domain-containing protein